MKKRQKAEGRSKSKGKSVVILRERCWDSGRHAAGGRDGRISTCENRGLGSAENAQVGDILQF